MDKQTYNLGLLNESRIKILGALLNCPDSLCGCDLIDRLDMPKNLLSYHLKLLRDRGLVEETRCGQRKRYRIKPEKLMQIKILLELLEKL